MCVASFAGSRSPSTGSIGTVRGCSVPTAVSPMTGRTEPTAPHSVRHAEPAFMTGTDDANHPTYYCADCVAEMAVRALERAEKTMPASTYVVIGSVLPAGALVAGFGVWEAVRGSGGAWCVLVLAF